MSSNLTRSTKTQPTRLYANILSMGSHGHRVDFGACPRFSHSFNALAGVGTVSATRESPHDLHAQEFLDAGVEALEEIIESHGKFSQYPFHGLGSQTLAWIHRSEWSKSRLLFCNELRNSSNKASSIGRRRRTSKGSRTTSSGVAFARRSTRRSRQACHCSSARPFSTRRDPTGLRDRAWRSAARPYTNVGIMDVWTGFHP